MFETCVFICLATA